MYQVMFKDRTSTLIDAKEGERLKETLFKLKTPRNIELNGELYNTTHILAVRRAVGSTIEAKPDYDKPVLVAGKQCTGTHSIARELMRIASKDKNWKLLSDQKWREEQTKKLKATGQKFCDAKAGKCACPQPVPA